MIIIIIVLLITIKNTLDQISLKLLTKTTIVSEGKAILKANCFYNLLFINVLSCA